METALSWRDVVTSESPSSYTDQYQRHNDVRWGYVWAGVDPGEADLGWGPEQQLETTGVFDLHVQGAAGNAGPLCL